MLTWNCALAAYDGRRVGDVLDELRGAGLTFIYSSQIVPAGLRVIDEPEAIGGLALAREILAAHGLGVRQAAPGVYAVISQPEAREQLPQRALAPAAREPELEEVVVQTSRYTFAAVDVVSQTFLTQEQVKNVPRLADETLRVLQRLPGTTTNGFSSIGSVRGGEPNETAIVLDGLRLYEPFHLKNFLSPVSLLDSRVIADIEFYSGGFPAVHGDRMSAIIDASTVRPTDPSYYEFGLNLFHASALAATQFAGGRGNALLSARRSNAGDLAHYAENDFGEPNYSDAFARVDYRLDDATHAALDMLISGDSIRATRSSGTQRARAEYRNIYAWGTLDREWSEHASSRLIVSYTDLLNERRGEVAEPGSRAGSVRDNRAFHIVGLRLENTLDVAAVTHRFGLEARRLWGKYDYASTLRIEPDFPFLGSAAVDSSRAVAPKPDGFESSAYWDARTSLDERWTLHGGMRIDTQTYDGSDDGEQWSPRLGVLYTASPRTRLRASWGRFFQSQGINELQVEDGVDRFHPAQYADHAILSVDHDFSAGFDLRAEVYRKDYRRVSPRFENLFDPLALFPEAEYDRVMIDANRSRAIGVELMLRMRQRGPWSGWLGYAWSRAEDRIGSQYVPRSRDQRYAATFGAVWARGPWTVTLANSYHSGWPTSPLEISYDTGTPQLVTDRRNRERFDFYNSFDFRVNRTFILPRGALDVFVEVSNGFDQQNQCCVEYDISQNAAGVPTYSRSVDSWLPLVPSAGILWRYGSDGRKP
jgi:hypothetical protein